MTISRRIIASLAIIVGFAAAGCATTNTSTSPYQVTSDLRRNPLRAQEFTRQAAERMDDDPVAADELLRKALAEDLWHGPAHNNLGVLALRRGDLYEAAHEFEWARKLMPGHPDPRVNLALTLERAGRIDDALATYEAALEVYPYYLPGIQGIARLQIRYNKTDDRTREYLAEIAMRCEEDDWRVWARQQMLKPPE